jgi:DNA-binding PadR family transcriptional regulator
MSSIDLFLLGFLKEKPISAYDLAKKIKENQLDQMIKISTPAVYKNLLRLKQKGYIKARNLKAGNMPHKTSYSITEKGEIYFSSLMFEQSNKNFIAYFDFNSLIINLDLVSKKEALKMLDNFKKVLIQKREEHKRQKKQFSHAPFVGKSIIKQLDSGNETLIKWLKEFKDNYK